MKKSFWGLFAITMLFAASCQTNLDLDTNAGETSVVSFKVGTPEIATRTYSDGLSATVLQYAVYDEAGNEMSDLTVTDGEIHGSTTVNLQLTTGQTYSVIFWAAAEGAPYTVDFSNKKMSVDYSEAVSNDESRDAFYKYHTFTVKGAQTETIELKRPFAQLNIGTADYAASASAGYTPVYSYVKVPVSSELNLADGSVNAAAEKEFKLAAIPEGETFPVGGYEYLSMNYLLVAADKEVVDVEFGYSENDTAKEKTRTVGSVPVQRNYRTNIYGNLLTSEVDINVVINPEYDEPAYEADPLQLIAAIGGVYNATGDIDLTLTDAPYLNIDQGMVLNMNGYTFKSGSAADYGIIARGGNSVINDAEIVSNGGGIAASGGASVTFNSGSVYVDTGSTSGRYLFYLVGEGSTVTINGGDFSWDPADNQKRAYIYAGAGTTAYVNGGNFGKASTRSGYTDGFLGNGTIIVTGGRFGFNPSKWVANGYSTIKNGTTWVVVPEIVASLSNVTESTTVELKNDVTVSTGTTIHTQNAEADITINGNGNSIISTAASTADFTWEGGTIPAMSTILSSNNGSTVTVNDLTFGGTMSALMLGHYQNATYNTYNTVLNNVNVIDAEVVSFSSNISPAVCIYGTATLNDCNIYGTTLSELDTDPMWPVYDVAAVNYSTTYVNGGKIGSIFAWNQAALVIDDGAKVEKIIVRGNMNTGNPKWSITIKAGTTIGSIDLSAITTKTKVNITIETGATVGKIVANGVEYASIEEFKNA